MKKIMMTMLLLLAGLAVSAQVTLTESGVFEKKEVVVVEGVTAAELYNRAIEALSDWAGAEGRSKYGIDSQDKEAGMIIYKGKDYLGFRKFAIYGWYIYTDFMLKIRCKDGRAQVTVTDSRVSSEQCQRFCTAVRDNARMEVQGKLELQEGHVAICEWRPSISRQDDRNNKEKIARRSGRLLTILSRRHH